MEKAYRGYCWRRLKDFVVGDIICQDGEEHQVVNTIPYGKIITLYFLGEDTRRLKHFTEHRENRYLSKMRPREELRTPETPPEIPPHDNYEGEYTE